MRREYGRETVVRVGHVGGVRHPCLRRFRGDDNGSHPSVNRRDEQRVERRQGRSRVGIDLIRSDHAAVCRLGPIDATCIDKHPEGSNEFAGRRRGVDRIVDREGLGRGGRNGSSVASEVDDGGPLAGELLGGPVDGHATMGRCHPAVPADTGTSGNLIVDRREEGEGSAIHIHVIEGRRVRRERLARVHGHGDDPKQDGVGRQAVVVGGRIDRHQRGELTRVDHVAADVHRREEDGASSVDRAVPSTPEHGSRSSDIDRIGSSVPVQRTGPSIVVVHAADLVPELGDVDPVLGA